MSFQYDLFLSHNGADKPWTERLAIAVEADRSGPPLKVFFDKWDLKPGADIPIELETALQASRHIGLVLSPEALKSDWVSLERSTAIMGDPSSSGLRLIPLLRRTCKVPAMLSRLKHIDFRREQDFETGLTALINVLRGRPAARGSGADPSDAFFREDAALLHQHRKMFDRPAFRTSCIEELFLQELTRAIDDTSAAISTGSLYSRSGNLLSTFPDRNEYKLPEFKDAFARISSRLAQIKRAIVDFEILFRRINPRYSDHSNFYAMMMSFAHDTGGEFAVQQLVKLMDEIDTLRNDVIVDLNTLFSRCGEEPLRTIQTSSSILKAGGIGGADELSRYLR